MTELEQTIIEKARMHLANLLLTDTTEKSAEKTLSFYPHVRSDVRPDRSGHRS